MNTYPSVAIGMAMIVRDEARTIEACLSSFWDHVDEVVIVDTGSKDETITKIITAALGGDDARPKAVDARVAEFAGGDDITIGKLRLLHFKWVNDFAKARQFSWDQLTSDWGIWCDGDDVLVGCENLRGLASSAPDVVGAFIFEYDYARDPQGNCICRLQRERLIRRGVGEHWELPVHEVCQLPPDRMPQSSDAVRYVHNRLPDKFALDRNYKILLREYKANAKAGRPQSPRTVGYLGSECLVLGRFAEAIPYLEEHLTLTTWDEERCQTAYKLVQAILAAGEPTPDLTYAERMAYEALKAKPEWADGYLALMDVAMHKREYPAAIEYAKRVLELKAPQTMLITNPLSYQTLPLIALAQACNEIGDVRAALVAAHQALELMPGEPRLVEAFERYREHVKAEETTQAVLNLREVLVRHDENFKAWKLFDAVPYFVERNPAILAAKADQRYMVAHALGDDDYRDYYWENPNEVPFDVHGIDIADVSETFGRARFLKAGLKSQGKNLKVLDCGCNDGWMAAAFKLDGHDVDGIELNTGAVERARDRGVNVKQGFVEDCATLYTPGTYDAVYMFEVIEHVQDPAYTLSCLEKMLKPGGRIYISTPNGAYERGNIPNWWVVERKGHLRAMTVFEIGDLCRSRGELEGFCVDDRERLIYAAYTPEFVPDLAQVQEDAPSTPVNVVDIAPRKRVNFFLGEGWQDFAPHDIQTKGLGGSETAAVKMAEQFADRGYLVTVYAGKGSTQGLYGRVAYRPASEWDPSEPCELFVSSRVPEVFDRPVNAAKSFLWLHDTDCGDRLTERRASQVDHVLVLSQWHRDHVASLYPFVEDRLVVTSNGVENDRFNPDAKKQPIVVYTSSPDRGLDIVLDVWPEVKAAVPDAELHHAYAPVYFEIAAKDPHLGPFAAAVTEKSSELDGVFNHGSLNAQQLADLYDNAKVWAYPSWNTPHGVPFCEVSCITALEAQAAGLVCVASKRGALPETLRKGVWQRDTPPTKAWKTKFARDIIAALNDEKKPSTPVDQSWESVAAQWHLLMTGLAEPQREAA